MANIYALRVDKEVALVKDWLTSIGASGFGVRETVDGSNEHWHFLIRTDKKEQALRKSMLTAVVGLRGNGAYSLAIARDPEAYEKYMCKGDNKEVLPEIVWSHGFDARTERLQYLHDTWWDSNAAENARKRKLPVTDFVVAACKDNAVQWDDRKGIARLYIKELAKRQKPINLYAVKSAVNAIQVALCPNDDAVEELVDRATTW